MTQPRVGVVVVSHNGRDLTLDCLRSLEAVDWPADRYEVVLVDNASSEDVVSRVRAQFPLVRVIKSTTNRGFAGGCNMGVRALPEVDLVALVNNDASVAPNWLRPLVSTIVSDTGLGAVCPKILFAGTFREVTLHVPTSVRGRGDSRPLGVRLSGAHVGERDVWPRTQLVRGFWGLEPPGLGQWTGEDALLRLPIEDDDSRATLRIAAERPLRLEVHSGTEHTVLEVDTIPRWLPVPTSGSAHKVINNVGTDLTPDGFGVDRGYLQVDDGRFDRAEDAFAWCGAAVLLRREYLDDVGLFDERLFLYYEDLELAWRGRARGWRYRYVPESVVHHVHAATSGEGSALKEHYNERNRLLVLARHGSRTQVCRALGRHLLVTASYARRDLVSPVLHGRRPHASVVFHRFRALMAAFVRLPRAQFARRTDREHAKREAATSNSIP